MHSESGHFCSTGDAFCPISLDLGCGYIEAVAVEHGASTTTLTVLPSLPVGRHLVRVFWIGTSVKTKSVTTDRFWGVKRAQ